MDDVELAGVCAGSGGYYSAVRWLSLYTLSQCALGLCRQVRVSAADYVHIVSIRFKHMYVCTLAYRLRYILELVLTSD